MKKTGSKWTQDEIEILKKYYWDLGPLALTKMIPNHPHCSIVAKGRKLGLNSKEGVLWTDEEIEIMKKYYPTEGTKVCNRLQNRSKSNVKHKAQHLGIKYDQTIVEWDQTEDEIIYEFFKTHEKKSFHKIPELIQELCDNGFTGHGAKSVYMRLHNICYLETGYGFSHASKQSKSVHMNNKKVWLYNKKLKQGNFILPNVDGKIRIDKRQLITILTAIKGEKIGNNIKK